MSVLNIISVPVLHVVDSCVYSYCRFVCSSSEWNEIDPSEREDLNLKMEDGEFW